MLLWAVRHGVCWQRHIKHENLVARSMCSRSYDIDLTVLVFYFVTIEQKWTLHERRQSPKLNVRAIRVYSGKKGVVGSTPFRAERLRTYHS